MTSRWRRVWTAFITPTPRWWETVLQAFSAAGLAGLVLIAFGQPWQRVLVMMAATGTGGVIGAALRCAFPRRDKPSAWPSLPFPPERLD